MTRQLHLFLDSARETVAALHTVLEGRPLDERETAYVRDLVKQIGSQSS